MLLLDLHHMFPELCILLKFTSEDGSLDTDHTLPTTGEDTGELDGDGDGTAGDGGGGDDAGSARTPTGNTLATLYGTGEGILTGLTNNQSNY